MKELRPYQIQAKSSIKTSLAKGNTNLMLVMATGCHAKDTGIIMYNGTVKPVQDVKQGDVIMGDDSTPRTILGIARGREMMYEISPTKGVPFVVNENHILSLKRTGVAERRKKSNPEIENVTVKDYLNWPNHKKHLYKLRRAPITCFSNIGSSTHPYWMGLWTGDGSISGTEITIPDQEIENWFYGEFKEFCSWNHPEIKIRKVIPENRCISFTFNKSDNLKNSTIKNPLREICKEMILNGEKIIPDRILRNCEAVRIDFLAGLLDSDGHLDESGCGYEITTKYKTLSDQILFLCRSLGFAAYKKEKVGKISSLGFEGLYYRITISGDTERIPCKIERKKSKPRKQIKDVLVTGFSVSPKKIDDFYGFSLDGNHLYLTEDFTIHHNTGKTATAVSIAEDYNSTLFIVDAEELMDQASGAFLGEKFDPSFTKHIMKDGLISYIKSGGSFAGGTYRVGAIKADVFQPYGNVVFASAQTLHRRLDKLDPNQYDCVIIDEAHCYLAKSFFKGATFFTPKLRLSLTATPYRLDGLPLTDLASEISFEYNIDNAIKDGYLVELNGIRVKTNVNLDSVKTLGGEFNQKDLSNEVNTPARNLLIADSYLKYCKGRKTIGFGIDIQHCLDLAEAFREKGISADAVSSDEERTGDRSQKIKDFKEGKIDVLFNANILTKGFDEPSVACIITAAPTKSLARYLQQVGRGTRTLPGVINGLDTIEERVAAIKASAKSDCIILDIVDMTNRHSIVNTWEIDKQKPVEERTFVTKENKDKILLDRLQKSVKIFHTRTEDEQVNLLKLPTLKISKSWRMEEDATPAQLAAIAKWGYDTTETHYTKSMIQEIFGQQEASAKQISFLKWKGYDVSGFVSVSVATAAFKEIREKEEKAKRDERNEKIKNNNPFKF